MKPVLVDSRASTYTMDTTTLEDAITDRTRCILAVHLFGNSCNTNAVMKVAKRHGLFVIEDCCDSLGTGYRGRNVGSIGNMGTFSFHPAHQITTMEGGAITTSDDARLRRAFHEILGEGRSLQAPWNRPG